MTPKRTLPEPPFRGVPDPLFGGDPGGTPHRTPLFRGVPGTPDFRKFRSIPSCALGPPGIKSGSLGNYKGNPKNGTFWGFGGFSDPPVLGPPLFKGGGP